VGGPIRCPSSHAVARSTSEAITIVPVRMRELLRVDDRRGLTVSNPAAVGWQSYDGGVRSELERACMSSAS
jgi:hypothetical protein